MYFQSWFLLPHFLSLNIICNAISEISVLRRARVPCYISLFSFYLLKTFDFKFGRINSKLEFPIICNFNSSLTREPVCVNFGETWHSSLANIWSCTGRCRQRRVIHIIARIYQTSKEGNIYYLQYLWQDVSCCGQIIFSVFITLWESNSLYF